MSVSEQARIFCLFFIIGLFIGFIFDLFRSFRKNFKMNNIFIDLQDIFFLIISGIMFFRSIVVFNSGDIRFYMIFATISGILIYALTISESCVIIFDVILKSVKCIIKKSIKLLKMLYYFAIGKNRNRKSKIKEWQFWEIFLNLEKFVE